MASGIPGNRGQKRPARSPGGRAPLQGVYQATCVTAAPVGLRGGPNDFPVACPQRGGDPAELIRTAQQLPIRSVQK